MRQLLLVPIAFSLLATAAGTAASAAAPSPMASLRYLVGNWTCSFTAGGAHASYASTFSSVLGGNWLRERDTFGSVGSDEGTITYNSKANRWTVVVLGSDKSTTIFTAAGPNANHLKYRSVYPDASMTEWFDRVSATKFTVHFIQKTGGKTMRSSDVCMKNA